MPPSQLYWGKNGTQKTAYYLHTQCGSLGDMYTYVIITAIWRKNISVTFKSWMLPLCCLLSPPSSHKRCVGCYISHSFRMLTVLRIFLKISALEVTLHLSRTVMNRVAKSCFLWGIYPMLIVLIQILTYFKRLFN